MGTLLMRLLLACISISAAACLAQTSLAAEGRKSPGKFDRIAEPGDAANRTLLVIVRAFAAQPPFTKTRSFAMMHAAIYDAVNAIDRTHKLYSRGRSVSSNGKTQD
jgi:hypothetical protein